jgi:hypothetical protein
VPLHPYIPMPPAAASWCLWTHVRHAVHRWQRVPTIDHLDRVHPREGHHVAFTQDLVEFHAPGEGPRDHEILHYVVVPELALDGVRVIGTRLLEQPPEVVCEQLRLALAVACGCHHAHHVAALRFPIVTAVIVGRGCDPLKTLLVPLLATLFGVLDGNVERCLLATAWGASLMRTCLAFTHLQMKLHLI